MVKSMTTLLRHPYQFKLELLRKPAAHVTVIKFKLAYQSVMRFVLLLARFGFKAYTFIYLYLFSIH